MPAEMQLDALMDVSAENGVAGSGAAAGNFILLQSSMKHHLDLTISKNPYINFLL